MSIKKLPQDNNPLDFMDLVNPVVKAIKHCYQLTRQNKTKNCPWTGFEDGILTKNQPGVKETLSAHSLKHDEEEQGREALLALVGVAVRQGIEQGRRLAQEAIAGEIRHSNTEHLLKGISMGEKGFMKTLLSIPEMKPAFQKLDKETQNKFVIE